MNKTKIEIPVNEITTFCRRHHIRELALFGSVLRDDFEPDSDIDVLVEFEAGTRIGYFRFFRIEQELANLLGREVDMFTSDSLKQFAREEALRTCEVIYAG